MRKPAFCICVNKAPAQLRSYAAQLHCAADQRLCFHYIDIQYLYFLNTIFQVSNHLLWLSSPVCVGPGQKPLKRVFLRRGSYISYIHQEALMFPENPEVDSYDFIDIP